jgi:hypothetical protein
MAAVVALKVFIKLFKDPNASSIAAFRGPSFKRPPFPLPSLLEGAMFLQNKEWLMCPEEQRNR